MQNLIDKFKLVLDSLEKEHGEVTLFALFLREDAFEKWDVVVCAKWLNPESQNSYSLVNSEIQKFIKNGSLTKLSRIVIISNNNPLVKLLQNCYIGKEQFQIPNPQFLSDILLFNIKSAYLLKCINDS